VAFFFPPGWVDVPSGLTPLRGWLPVFPPFIFEERLRQHALLRLLSFPNKSSFLLSQVAFASFFPVSTVRFGALFLVSLGASCNGSLILFSSLPQVRASAFFFLAFRPFNSR